MDFHEAALLAGGSQSEVNPARAMDGSLSRTRSHHPCSRFSSCGQSQ